MPGWALALLIGLGILGGLVLFFCLLMFLAGVALQDSEEDRG